MEEELKSKIFFILTFVFLIGILFVGYMLMKEGRNIQGDSETLKQIISEIKSDIKSGEQWSEEEYLDYKKRINKNRINVLKSQTRGLTWMSSLVLCFCGLSVSMIISGNLAVKIAYDKSTKRNPMEVRRR